MKDKKIKPQGNQIKALLYMRGHEIQEYIKETGYHPVTMSKKFDSGSFKLVDLLVLANLTKTKLVFIDEETNEIVMELVSDTADRHEPDKKEI